MMEERKQVLLANKDGEDLTVSIPCIRFCPGCRIPIEHISGCKHMKCFNCKLEFCFVCLAILKRTWPCGNFNEYCGTVADVQKLGQ
jgi:LSD1 subclass zinc finger protein